MTTAEISIPLAGLHRRLREARIPTPRGTPCETQNLIYALCEPDTGRVRYVGASSRGLRRARQHGRLGELLHDTTRKAAWIVSLLRRGETYRVAILVWGIRFGDLRRVESACIAHYRRRGGLTNETAGGYSPVSSTTPLERLRAREEREEDEAWMASQDAFLQTAAGRRYIDDIYAYAPGADWP